VSPIPPELVDVLACPESRAPLVHFPAGADGEAEFLLCPTSCLRYPVEDGLPVMLVEEAERLQPAEVQRLLGVADAAGLRIPD
jgi:uncharacterized protein YbaR (Trm112 family)